MIPGFVRVSVKGQQCQRFVNLCRGREMDLKRIIRTGETELQLTMKVVVFSADFAIAEKNRGTYPHPEKKEDLCFFCFSVKEEK